MLSVETGTWYAQLYFIISHLWVGLLRCVFMLTEWCFSCHFYVGTTCHLISKIHRPIFQIFHIIIACATFKQKLSNFMCPSRYVLFKFHSLRMYVQAFLHVFHAFWLKSSALMQFYVLDFSILILALCCLHFDFCIHIFTYSLVNCLHSGLANYLLPLFS